MAEKKRGATFKEKKVVSKIDKEPGHFYYVDKEGNVIARNVKTGEKKVVGKIERKPKAFYWVDGEGNVWEAIRE